MDKAKILEWNYEGNVLENEKELNDRVSNLEWKIRTLFDKYAPVKTFRVNRNKVNWMTDELRHRIDKRNNMKRKLETEGGSSAQWQYWKKFKNKVNRDIKHAKRQYLTNHLENKIKTS